MLRRFFGYYRPHRRLFALDFSCAVLSGVLELAFPMAVGLFVDRLLPGENWGLIIFFAVALLVVYLINTGLMVVVGYWGHMLGINIETEMRRKSFDHLQKLSFRFYDNQKTGHLVARVTKDLEEIGEVAHHGPEDLFVTIMTFVGAFALMAYVYPPLALIAALVVPVTGWITGRYGMKMTGTWKTLFGRVGEFNARIEDNVGGIRVVQAFANEDHERSLFAENNAKYRSTKLEAYRIMTASMSLSYFSMRLAQVVVMIAGAYFVLHNRVSAGEFVSFLLLVGVFFRPLEKINTVLESYPKGIAGFKRYTELLDTAPDIQDAPDAVTVSGLRGDIRYENVTFGYGPEHNVLHDINLTIRAGETIAFVGPSGAGKTTIASLLPRFYEIDTGRITIDGIDIRAMTLASLRREIGVVQQDVFLFTGTVRENISYGRLDATEEEMQEAIRLARMESVIANMPLGLDTVIGERGVKLSGGQKQRLAIARM
ncbi:MAG: ABC transporter ATP-binding protein/permease, partial [Chloroflexota bacterium]|nr:ABC transporter ATP-binding protein/permease [Chloroflexota bacterium]